MSKSSESKKPSKNKRLSSFCGVKYKVFERFYNKGFLRSDGDELVLLTLLFALSVVLTSEFLSLLKRFYSCGSSNSLKALMKSITFKFLFGFGLNSLLYYCLKGKQV